MLHIHKDLLVGQTLEVLRSNGDWEPAVVTQVAMQLADQNEYAQPEEKDYIEVALGDGRKKIIRLQQDLADEVRPLGNPNTYKDTACARLRASARNRSHQGVSKLLEEAALMPPPKRARAPMPEPSAPTLTRPMEVAAAAAADSIPPWLNSMPDDLSDDDLLEACQIEEAKALSLATHSASDPG